MKRKLRFEQMEMDFGYDFSAKKTPHFKQEYMGEFVNVKETNNKKEQQNVSKMETTQHKSTKGELQRHR